MRFRIFFAFLVSVISSSPSLAAVNLFSKVSPDVANEQLNKKKLVADKNKSLFSVMTLNHDALKELRKTI